jgi:hypothetical protein
MFQCNHCGAQFLEHKTNCPDCGALIKAIPLAEIDLPGRETVKTGDGLISSIRAICTGFEEIQRLRIDDTIDQKRMKTVRYEFNIPTDERVIMVYDDTLWGNNKKGFAICQGGLYWKNDWAVETKRSFLSWQDFTERSITLDGLNISLDRGDRLGTAGAGDTKVREQIVVMLNDIKGWLKN